MYTTVKLTDSFVVGKVTQISPALERERVSRWFISRDSAYSLQVIGNVIEGKGDESYAPVMYIS